MIFEPPGPHFLLRNYKASVGTRRIFALGSPALLIHAEPLPTPGQRAGGHVARGRAGAGRVYIPARRSVSCERRTDSLNLRAWASAGWWVRARLRSLWLGQRGFRAGRSRPRGGFGAPAGKGRCLGPAFPPSLLFLDRGLLFCSLPWCVCSFLVGLGLAVSNRPQRTLVKRKRVRKSS